MLHKHKNFFVKKVYDGRILSIMHRCVKFSDEKCIEYEVATRKNIVVIIPLLESGDLILISQYRAPLGKSIWEFPAGSVEIGELPVNAAERELEEEIGYKSGKIELLQEFYTAPHFCDERAYIYIARELSANHQNLQEREIIQPHTLTQAKLIAKYYEGEILNAKTILAYHALFKYLEENK